MSWVAASDCDTNETCEAATTAGRITGGTHTPPRVGRRRPSRRDVEPERAHRARECLVRPELSTAVDSCYSWREVSLPTALGSSPEGCIICGSPRRRGSYSLGAYDLAGRTLTLPRATRQLRARRQELTRSSPLRRSRCDTAWEHRTLRRQAASPTLRLVGALASLSKQAAVPRQSILLTPTVHLNVSQSGALECGTVRQ
jgi:hypothetical protein